MAHGSGATQCPGSISIGVRSMPKVASKYGWLTRLPNALPGGGSMGEGTSPGSTGVCVRLVGSALGMAASNALEYAWYGLWYMASAPPISTIFPMYITATRSDMCRTTDKSCEMNRYAKRSSFCKSCSKLSTCDCTDTSKALTGSSSISNCGFCANALAMPMRCRCPPENSCGNLSAAVCGSPTISNSSFTLFILSEREHAFCICKGSAMI